MAGILNKYFKDPPKSVGQSTFAYNQNSALSADDLKYTTLIGSVNDTKWGQQESTRPNDPALLMHAAELYWGDATFVNDEALKNLANVSDLTKSSRIRTTHDIIAILEYLMANVGKSNNTASISLNPSSLVWNSFNTRKDKQNVAATVAFGDAQQIIWSVTGDFTADTLIGPNTLVSATRHPDATKTSEYLAYDGKEPGTIRITAGVSSNNEASISGNSHTITAAFTQASDNFSDTVKYSGTLKATYEDIFETCSLEYNVTDTQTAKGKAEGTWTWDTSSINNSGLTIYGSSTKSLTITNETPDPISVEGLTIIVSNNNGNSITITLRGSVAAKPEDKIYYCYIGYEDPRNVENITEYVEQHEQLPGWHLIGTEFNETLYIGNNPLVKYEGGGIPLGGDDYAFLAIPGSDRLIPRNKATLGSIVGTAWLDKGKKTINNVEYRIYQSKLEKEYFNDNILYA